MYVCRHPLDQQNTRLLQLVPGLDMITRGLLGELSVIAAVSDPQLHACGLCTLDSASLLHGLCLRL